MTFWTRSCRQLPVKPCTVTRQRSSEPSTAGTWTALIGTPSDAAPVLDLLVKTDDDLERAEAEKTAAALLQKIGNPAGRSMQLRMRLMREIKGVSGIHMMAYRQEDTVPEIIERSGVLAGRVPWYPGRDQPIQDHQEATA